MAALYCAVSLYHQGKFAEGLKLLDRRRQRDLAGDLTRIFLIAELPDGQRLALDEYQKLAKMYPQEGLAMRTLGEASLFLGRTEQALAILRRTRSPVAGSREWQEFYETRHQFECGQVSEQAYLAKAGASHCKQLYAHYELGLFRLADGDHAGARHHFQKAVSTGVVWEVPWAWSRMFLNRLAEDGQWPPWIPAKKDPAKIP
jgi:hypothetical protein